MFLISRGRKSDSHHGDIISVPAGDGIWMNSAQIFFDLLGKKIKDVFSGAIDPGKKKGHS